jgi:hypothetical protein
MVAMIVFYQLESKNIKGIKEEHDENLFYYLVSYVPSMPELQCSYIGVGDECIDLSKAKAFDLMDSEYYREVFGYKKIILKTYEEVILYDWAPRVYSEERKITSPVSVYDPNQNKYLVGVLEVYMYEE